MSRKHAYFNTVGQPFGNFGESVSPEESNLRVRAMAAHLVNARQGSPWHECARQATASFLATDADLIEPYSMPDTRLLRTDPLLWLARSKPEAVDTFSKWMGQRHAAHMKAIERDHASTVYEGILDLAQLNVLPDEIVREVSDVLETTPIYPLSSLEAGVIGAVAVCDGDYGVAGGIGLSNNYRDTATFTGPFEQQPSIYVHEGLHGANSKRRAGFTYGLTELRQPTSMVEEGVTSHIEAASRDGDFVNIVPEDRANPGWSHVGNRTLLGALSMGPRPIELQLLVDASASPLEDANNPTSPRRELESRLNTNVEKLLKPGDATPLYTVLGEIADIRTQYERETMKVCLAYEALDKLAGGH
jgi:hypothetical protein